MIGRNIKKYRLLNGLSMRDLATKLNVSHQTIKKYEDGNMIPSSTRLIEIAKILKIKVSNLTSSYNVPILKYTNFRKKSSLSKKKEEGLHMLIEDEIAKYIEILDFAHEKYSFNRKEWSYDVNNINDIEDIAIKVRKRLGVSNEYSLDNLTDKLEDNNFLILEINYEEDFDGFCEYVDDLAFIILSSKGYERNRFTLAHELGHLILDFKEKLDESEKETYCNIFASCLLLPKDAIIRELHFYNRILKNISMAEILFLAMEYNVSLNAVIMRLYNLNIINENHKKYLFIELSKNGFKSNQLKIVEEHPMRLKKIIFRLEAENIISKNKAIDYLGVTTNEYFKFDFNN